MREKSSKLINLTTACLISGCGLLMPFSEAKKQLELHPQNQTQEEACKLLSEGTSLLAAKQPFKARKLLEKSAELWNDNAGIHFNLGCCYEECALYDAAIAEFQKALQLDSKLLDCLVNIGSCYQVQGKTDDAIVFFQGYLKKTEHPEDAEMVRGMIIALEKYKKENVASDPHSPDYLDSVCRDGHFRRWPQRKMPLAIYISNGTDENGHPVNGFREEFNYSLLAAIDDWMKASRHKLSYRLVTDRKDADLSCSWTDNPAFLGGNGHKVEQGVAQLHNHDHLGPDGTIEISSAQVRILLKDLDTGTLLTAEDVKKVCLHEIGHALGLDGHSPSNRDVMFFSEASSVWPALTKRDKATIQRLYQDFPEPAPIPEGPPPSGPG